MVTLKADFLSSASFKLCLPDFQGKIHSVFQRVVNLLSGGELAALADSSLGDLPNALLVQLSDGQGFDKLGLKPGMFVFGDGHQLIVPDAGVIILLEGVRQISSLKHIEGELLSKQERQLRLDRARNLGHKLAPDMGLAPLWHIIKELLYPPIDPILATSPFLVQAVKPLEDLVLGINAGNVDLVWRGANGLSGLGVGLTPSGDDLLTGLTGALILLGEASPREKDYTLLVPYIVDAAQGKTNLIALNYLIQAQCGQVSTALANFISSISATTSYTVEDALRNLFSFGATSGSELALGAYIGLSLESSSLSTT